MFGKYLHRRWILPGRPPHILPGHLPQCPLVGCYPMMCSVVSPVQRWNHFFVRLEETNLLLQSDLHENVHEVVQFTDYFGAQVCS